MNTIINFIKENNQSGTLFVLKGFDLTENGFNKVDLEGSFNEKAFNRLSFLTQQEMAVISYEEFICLNALIKEVFKKIIILDNPIYLNLYPVNVNLRDDIKNSLLNHFDNEASDDTELSDIDHYLKIYNNFVETNYGFACCFNTDNSQLISDKIEIIVLGNNNYSKELEECSDINKTLEYRNIYSELDYLNLLQDLINLQNNYSINYENCILGKETIKRALMLLNSAYTNRLFLASSNQQITAEEFKYEDIDDSMKKYWGYDSYKQLKIYDLAELQKGIKKIKTISQKRIINDILEQSENSINGRSHRDIFVTAPTGAGKSLLFQLPAIYLAEKYNLVTLVITPLIGLMEDQIKELKAIGYDAARTINSDISPIIKQEILDDLANSKVHILYLSPESLLSKSDIEQLIGTRKIGMVVIDEAHIVTTWGKQFRPDYWFLGDHIQKIRTAQDKKYNQSFVLATFTATAIYGGKEDMYGETKISLHMFDPITYLGYLKRDNIEIDISEIQKVTNKEEYEINKFDDLIDYVIKPNLARSQKILIYFPTVSLISRFNNYCFSKNLGQYISIYHGQLTAEMKKENFEEFKNGNKKVMVATKAFGMGINIPDISVVSHFAPTGNVCDYMQEIGRVARRSDIQGYAIYKHMSNDFKHINRLQGLSAIKNYQLVNVIKKILELYKDYIKNPALKNTKKRNAMLIDTECFSYIFSSPLGDENDLINKVKTAMLLIQKDYVNRSFSPFHFRPSTLFEYGFLAINPVFQTLINKKYNNSVEEVYSKTHICKVNLKKIWEKDYQDKMSFPKFKYLLYTDNKELKFNTNYKFSTAISIDIIFENKYFSVYEKRINALKAVVNESVLKNKYFTFEEMLIKFSQKAGINKYLAESIINTFIASINNFKKNNYGQNYNSKIYTFRQTLKNEQLYLFDTSVDNYFKWIEKTYNYIESNLVGNKLYLDLSSNNNHSKGIFTVLGLLESLGVLKFRSLGGTNSQIYIYVNETKTMQIVSDKPYLYKNKLLEVVNNRHNDSVNMLSFLYKNNFSSDEIWEHLENYFLGILPKELQDDNIANQFLDTDALKEIPIKYETGSNLKEDYSNWEEASGLYEVPITKELSSSDIPLADQYNSSLIIDEFRINGCFTWVNQKLMLTTGEERPELRELAEKSGWICFPINSVSIDQIQTILE